jgi:hypothetical protein
MVGFFIGQSRSIVRFRRFIRLKAVQLSIKTLYTHLQVAFKSACLIVRSPLRLERLGFLALRFVLPDTRCFSPGSSPASLCVSLCVCARPRCTAAHVAGTSARVPASEPPAARVASAAQRRASSERPHRASRQADDQRTHACTLGSVLTTWHRTSPFTEWRQQQVRAIALPADSGGRSMRQSLTK